MTVASASYLLERDERRSRASRGLTFDKFNRGGKVSTTAAGASGAKVFNFRREMGITAFSGR